LVTFIGGHTTLNAEKRSVINEEKCNISGHK